jgi:cell surface protein SprA
MLSSLRRAAGLVTAGASLASVMSVVAVMGLARERTTTVAPAASARADVMVAHAQSAAAAPISAAPISAAPVFAAPGPQSASAADTAATAPRSYDLGALLAPTPDPITAPDDSLGIPDVDSTARATFLPPKDRGGVTASPFPQRGSSLYLSPSGGRGIKRIITVDSTRDVVRIRETINGRDVRVPIEMPLDEYIRARYDYERNRRTADYIASQGQKDGDQLDGILKNLTEFDIPIPPNPLMSIFGDRSRISLRISGSIDISAGFRIESSDQQSVFLAPTQFSPNFRQQVQINVNGLIGDKLSIRADWSTERTFDYENQLKIKYTGYEDEIVQSVEAGNVSLQTPATLMGGSGALFGIKAEFQVGPLRLQTVASQKKGESSRMSVNGGSTEQQFERRAYDYAENHYFVNLEYRDNDLNGRNVYEMYYNYRAYGGTAPLQLKPDKYIKDMEVWITRPQSAGTVTDPEERPGVALIDLPGTYLQVDPLPASIVQLADTTIKIESQSGLVELGNFKRLKKDVDYVYNPVTGILTMNQNVMDDQVIAVAYRVEGSASGPADDEFYGTFVNDPRFANNPALFNPRLVLKLVKPKNLSPSFRKAWLHRVRSIYSMNARNLKAEDFASFKIVYRSGGSPDVENLPSTAFNLLRLFGLDNTDDAGGPPDGKIDFLPGLTVDPIRGELIFPTLEPWNSGLRKQFLALPSTDPSTIEPYLYPAVYDTTKTIARQSDKDKILIVGKTKGSSTSTYTLGFNIVEGSVRVLLDGQPLTPGSDYTVDYQVGQVKILKPEALIPGAKVDIDFEKHDFFSFASKTMLGLRGEMNLGKNSFLGFTWLNLNQKTLSDKVRIGEEPINNTMFGVDARTQMDLPFITDALNTLPFITTKEKSSLTLQGEFAMMSPDPNTKKSSIASDNSKGIAYIDDFEGSRVFIPLQTAYSVWKLSSPPAFMPNYTTTPVPEELQNHRGRLSWFNIPITASSNRSVVVTDIWPDRLAAREDQRVTVLDLDYRPAERGQFNYTPDLAAPTQSWAGIMRTLPVNATNLVDGNYNYIELWMRIENGAPEGRLLIDVGKISEDVIPNGQLNSEDLVLDNSIRNGILDPGEDVGLDMLTDAQELEKYPALGPDPSLDNFAYNVNDWTNFNGTQGNFNDQAGFTPDTEDLNNNGILDLTNDYFQYEISLDTTSFAPSITRNPYVVGGGTNGWYQFRIPLTDFAHRQGTPSLDNVEFIRLAITGLSNQTTIRIAEFNFVGNQWYERQRGDSLFTVSVVNIEDNPDYTSPPGVARERDRRRPDQEVYLNEQSLSLTFRDLPDTTYREAYRLFPNTGVDLFNYERMKMFVHGDPYLASNRYEVVMRFGIDTLNYYEYRGPVRSGWDTRNEIDIAFAELTAIKALRDSCRTFEKRMDHLGDSVYYKVVGCPDIVSVRFISVGVRNIDGRPLTGQIWCNELRVVGPDDRNGYAYTGSMNLRLADVADINATVNHSDPFFHGLSDRFSATRAWTTSWSMNTTINIDKAFPKEWQGTQIKVAYSHAENLSKPLLLPGQPDVNVEESVLLLERTMREQGKSQSEIDLAVRDARLATQTLEIRDSWAFPTVRLKAPGESWLIQDIVNRLDLSYNYSISRYRDPVLSSRRNWQWTGRIGYGYDFNRNAYVQPFRDLFDGIFLFDFYKNVKFYYLPSRMNMSADLSRSRVEEQRRFPYEERPYIRSFQHNRNLSFSYRLSEGGLLNLDGSYNSSIQTSLLHFETDVQRDLAGDTLRDPLGTPVLSQRQSSAVFSDIFFGGGGLNFGIPTRYTQQVSINSRPQIPRFFDLDKYVDLSAGYQVSYSWQENLQQLGLGRSASFNASINAQMNLRVKSFFDPLFSYMKDYEGASAGPGAGGAGAERMPVQGRRKSEVAIVDQKSELLKKQKELAELKRNLAKNDPKQLERMRAELEKSEAQLQALVGVQAASDSLLAAGVTTGLPEDTLDVPTSSFPSIGEIFGRAAYYLIKIPFLEYDNVGITFSESNSSQVTGVRGETGFGTFWTSPLFGNPATATGGPSRLYQLGLVHDPNPSGGTIGFKRGFPFVGIDGYERGLRAANPNGVYADNFTQSNTFSIRTNRPLWEGARLDLTWDLKWSVNKNYQLRTDALGVQTITSVTTTGSLERSYMTFPDFLFFSFFNTNMEAVNKRYLELLADPSDRRTDSDKLVEAFEEGLEAVPWLSKVLTSYMPRLNWGLRWDGIEKIKLIEGFADRISLEHRYTSSLSEQYRLSQDDGTRITDSKRVGYNFAPLVGLTFAFNKVWGGDLSINSRWGEQKTFDLNTSSANVVETSTSEISLTASFRKSGFEMPLFGLALKNDIDFSFSFSLNKSASRTYGVTDLGSGGQPREGTTRIMIEPRVRYVISQRVTSSLFYQYQRTRPDSSVGSRIPGTTIHTAGLELKISITGS